MVQSSAAGALCPPPSRKRQIFAGGAVGKQATTRRPGPLVMLALTGLALLQPSAARLPRWASPAAPQPPPSVQTSGTQKAQNHAPDRRPPPGFRSQPRPLPPEPQAPPSPIQRVSFEEKAQPLPPAGPAQGPAV